MNDHERLRRVNLKRSRLQSTNERSTNTNNFFLIFLKKTYNSKFISSKKFIKSLAAAIFQSSLETKSDKEMSFDQGDFIYKLNILKHYIVKNLELEYDSLCSLYSTLEKLQEPLLVKRVFVILYETQTVSKEGFDIWRRRNLKANRKEFLPHLKNFLSF
jgi:hypothetical protein